MPTHFLKTSGQSPHQCVKNVVTRNVSILRVWSAANSSVPSCVIANIAHWCHLPLCSKHGLRMLTWGFLGGDFQG